MHINWKDVVVEAPEPPKVIEELSTIVTDIKKERKALKRKIRTSLQKEETYKQLKLDMKKVKEELSETIVKKERKKKSTEIIEDSKEEKSRLEALALKTESLEKTIQMLKIENSRVSNMSSEKEEKLKQLVSDHKKLQVSHSNLIVENDYLRNLIEDNKPLEVFDESTTQFWPELINCVMELQDCNVSVVNIPKGITAVSALCGRNPNKLPSQSTINRMNDSRVSIASKQMKDISESENITLYSDETSKFGKPFEVFAIIDETQKSFFRS